MAETTYSKNHVRRSGRVLRDWWTSQVSFNDLEPQLQVEVYEAWVAFLWWRRQHSAPLRAARMGLISACNTTNCSPLVTQRLKREWTMLDKLRREPEMGLDRMQDIGGCRSVQPDLASVRAVQQRVMRETRARRLKRVRDYIEEPAASGYRSLHVIVAYHGRMIEMQIRTRVQHQWAITVENLGARVSHDLKSGEGPPEVLDLLAAISEAMSIEDAGQRPTQALDEKIARLRTAAMPYLSGGT